MNVSNDGPVHQLFSILNIYTKTDQCARSYTIMNNSHHSSLRLFCSFRTQASEIRSMIEIT